MADAVSFSFTVLTDSVPVISSAVSVVSTSAFVVTSAVAGLLTVSTASLQAAGAFHNPSSSLTSYPSRNLFVCHFPQLSMLEFWVDSPLFPNRFLCRE